MNYLKLAREELKLAEELGYGRRDPEFVKIREDIKSIEDIVKKGEKIGNLFEQVRAKLQALKKKISSKKHEIKGVN